MGFTKKKDIVALGHKKPYVDDYLSVRRLGKEPSPTSDQTTSTYVSLNLEEPVRVASPTRINLEEPVRVRPAQPG